MKNDKPKEIWYLTHSGFVASIVQTLVTFITIVGLLGIGAVLHSTIMQIIGFLFLCLMVKSFVVAAMGKRTTFHSPQALADELKRRHGVVAHEEAER